jgi:hypothetical protein
MRISHRVIPQGVRKGDVIRYAERIVAIERIVDTCTGSSFIGQVTNTVTGATSHGTVKVPNDHEVEVLRP